MTGWVRKRGRDDLEHRWAADSATGSPEKNAELALARAEHVAKLMRERGVPQERIEVRSEGGTASYEPLSANRNCRIELFTGGETTHP